MRTAVFAACTVAFSLSVGLALAPPAAANGLLVASPATEGPTATPLPPDAGRGDPRGPVTLVEHRMVATIRGRVAEVVVDQTFLNRSATQL
jgi:hypothetical protein